MLLICGWSSADDFEPIEREVDVDSAPENSDPVSTSNYTSMLLAIPTRSDGICY
jgi:hypothetical protein